MVTRRRLTTVAALGAALALVAGCAPAGTASGGAHVGAAVHESAERAETVERAGGHGHPPTEAAGSVPLRPDERFLDVALAEPYRGSASRWGRAAASSSRCTTTC